MNKIINRAIIRLEVGKKTTSYYLAIGWKKYQLAIIYMCVCMCCTTTKKQQKTQSVLDGFLILLIS